MTLPPGVRASRETDDRATSSRELSLVTGSMTTLAVRRALLSEASAQAPPNTMPAPTSSPGTCLAALPVTTRLSSRRARQSPESWNWKPGPAARPPGSLASLSPEPPHAVSPSAMAHTATTT